MNRLMLIRHLPAAIAYVAREAGKSWQRYWFLTIVNRNPDDCPY